MSDNFKSEINNLRARSSWYRLLAGVYAQEPDQEFITELRGEQCHMGLIELGIQFDDDFLSTELSELVENLACEYTMLFLAPGGFPAVESVRLQGGFSQTAITEVKAIYQAEKIKVKTDNFTIFDDHLAVELGFIATLLEQQAKALEDQNDNEAKRLEKVIKRFWVLHLGRWIRGFCTLIEEAADHSFYREMSILLNVFADSELELLNITVNDVDGGRWRTPKPAHLSQPMQCGGSA